ncbi:MAG: sugar phosphate nucleotidyltransferase [Candidatus Heimdallarchaeota archaeon]
MTKGIILSGGWGTRLRPLTCTIPKSLIPVVNKPVIERQILLLKSAGIKEIILAVSVMSEVVQSYFKDGNRLGVKIHYTNEKHPMGTAGAIKLAESYLKDENFFMLNGDVIVNFDFKDMLHFHERSKAKGTIASKIVQDPSPYGVLIVNPETYQLQKFLEKEEYLPPKGKHIPMPINAGVYILEPEIFRYIKPNKKISMERDIFHKLAAENSLYHFPITGIWKDIGKPYDLLKGSILLMNDILDNLNEKRQSLIDASADIDPTTKVIHPCVIGGKVIIRGDSTIGPNVIIGDNVYIDKGTEIKETLIYNESYISKNVDIEKSIISDNCLLEENVQLKGQNEDLVILASYVKVLKNVKLITKKNQSINFCHHEVVNESLI